LLEPEVDADPAPVELALPAPLVPEEPVEPSADVDPELEELAFDPLLVSEESFEPDVDVDRESDELTFVVVLVSEDVTDPCVDVDPELEEPVFVSLPAIDVESALLPLDCDPELFIARTACHQLSIEEFTVLPMFFEVEVVPAGASEFELVFAEVFDALCVLAVPPLTLGWTLIDGWISIDGCTLMIAVATALVEFRL
jgi:hypothetical protein